MEGKGWKWDDWRKAIIDDEGKVVEGNGWRCTEDEGEIGEESGFGNGR